MQKSPLRIWLIGVAFTAASAAASATPVNYVIDSSHTFPSFEADHWAGLSVWRGKINRTEGSATMDQEAGTGTIEVTMDMASIDFGHDGMNERAVNDILHVAEFPTATYTGRLVRFENGRPTAIEGVLTLHGVSEPVHLVINSFRCQPHWRTQVETCGADAAATINRADFGVDYDLDNGFFPEVKLLITVEARRDE